MKKIFILLACVFLYLGEVSGQNSKFKSQSVTRRSPVQRGFMPYWSIGAGVGPGNYFGDLAPKANYASTKLKYTRPSVSAEIEYKFSPAWAVELELSWIRLLGSDFESADPRNIRDRYRYLRNSNFRNDIFEAALQLEYDLIPWEGYFYERPTWRPYVFGGIGVFYHNPKGKTQDGRWVNLQPLRTEGQGLTPTFVDISGNPTATVDYQGNPIEYPDKPYSLIQMAIPFGAGIRYKLANRWDLAFEVGYRFLFTDYLDDVSGIYANPVDLAQVNPLSVEMANRTLEPRDPISGKDRDFVPVVETTNGFIADELGNPTVNGFGRIGDQRGSSNDRDIYIVTTFRISHLLIKKELCPAFRGRGRGRR